MYFVNIVKDEAEKFIHFIKPNNQKRWRMGSRRFELLSEAPKAPMLAKLHHEPM